VFYRMLSAQRRLLVEFVQAYFGERPVPVRYPLVSRRLVRRLGQLRLPLEPMERQVSTWFHTLFARPPRRLALGDAPLLLMCILHNLLFLCHPVAREMGRLYNVCRRRTEGFIATLPPARDRELIAVYHALLERFEPFLSRVSQHFEVQLGLERTVSKSPLTTLLWMESLSKVSFDNLKALFKDHELVRFVLLTVVDKERTVPERHLPRVRELIRTVGKFDRAGVAVEPGLMRELEALRSRFSGLRATSL
jgi:hypothetical protein